MDNIELNKVEQEPVGFDAIIAEEPVVEVGIESSVMEFDIGSHIHSLFMQAEKDKLDIEDRWMEDLRQFKGIYDQTVKNKLKAGRSQAFIGLTRTKVNAVTARVMDLQFPSSGEMNWQVSPTPEPRLPFEVVQESVTKWMEQNQRQPNPDEVRIIVFEEAKRRSTLMGERIKDQLVSSKYRDTMRNVIHSGNLFGTGVLKGPLVDYKNKSSWILNDAGHWEMNTEETMVPYVESVSVWDFYPDMAAIEPEDMRYAFQRHVMTRHQLTELSNRDDFNGKEIIEYIRSHPNGSSQYKNHEQELRTLDTEEDKAGQRKGLMIARDKRYDVIEYWGYIDADDMRAAGVPLPEEFDGFELCANVWLLESNVIKFEVAPVQAIGLPFYLYYFNKDETSIWGEGIPVIMRDPQRLFNASVRALLDNTAASAGPIYEINEALMEGNQAPDTLLPFTNVYRGGRGIEAQYPAIRVHTVPSHAQLYIQLINLFSAMADEATSIPKYLHGSNQGVGGAGRTMGGLSMLLGNSITVVKDQVKSLDDKVIKPFIRAMYHWNMELGDDDEVKGDFEVDAQGSASLIAKEVRVEKLIMYLQQTANPLDAPITNRAYLHREVARCLDLGDQAVKTDAIIAQEQQQQAQIQQQLAMMNQAIEEQKAYIAQLEQAVKGQHIASLDDPMSAANREVLVNAATE